MSGLITPAWALGADSHNAAIVRMALQDSLAGTGVVGNGMKVVHVPGELKVKAEPGGIYIPGTLGTHADARVNAGNQHASYSSLPEYFTTQGSYHTYLPEAEDLSVSTPSASHERIDLVVAAIEDAEFAGALNQAVLQIVTGTPAPEPLPPEPPASSVVLAQYRVPVGATEVLEANITDERPGASAASTEGKFYEGNPNKPLRGHSVVAAEQSRESAAPGVLTTPDEVTVYVPENAWVTVRALLTAKSSVSAAGTVGLYVDGTLVGSEATLTTLWTIMATNWYTGLTHLGTTTSGEGPTLPALNPYHSAGSGSANNNGTPCEVFQGAMMGAGTHTFKLQFSASSGSIAAALRHLLVEVHTY